MVSPNQTLWGSEEPWGGWESLLRQLHQVVVDCQDQDWGWVVSQEWLDPGCLECEVSWV